MAEASPIHNTALQSQRPQRRQQQQAPRSHGCQWPWANLQILSWALLSALAAGFFALIVPLYHATPTRHVLAGVYGGVVALTVGLALATTCIDPADPRVKDEQRRAKSSSSSKGLAAAAAAVGAGADDAGEEEGDGEEDNGMDGVGPDGSSGRRRRRCAFNSTDTAGTNATNAYCYLCRTDVAATSAHCRHCRKCCDAFDHHCLWLNTCIGRPNYGPFLGTVTAALALLGLQTAAAALLVARYALRRKAFVEQGEMMTR